MFYGGSLPMKFVLFVICLLCSQSLLASVSQWIPFKDHNGHVKIPVSVSGIDGYAILDTGANISAINNSFILKHDLSFIQGEKFNIKGVHGERKARFLRDIEVTMFGKPVKFRELAPVSLGHHENIVLLGSEFFKQFVIQIDYPNQKLRLLTRDSIDLEKHKNIKMRFDKVQGLPVVEVDIGDVRKLKLLLDTGNNGGVLLPRNVARRHNLLNKYPQDRAISTGIAMSVEVDTFSIPELQFGPYTMENVAMVVPADGIRTNIFKPTKKLGTRLVKRPPDGILGYDILKHFVLTIDYKKGLMHVGVPE